MAYIRAQAGKAFDPELAACLSVCCLSWKPLASAGPIEVVAVGLAGG